MTLAQQIITIAVAVVATMITRFLPFFIFPADKPVPRVVDYFGRVLPAAIFGMLMVYCLRNVSWLGGTHGIPEVVSLAVVVGLHLWKRNMLVSIVGGTACYMVLVQLVFA